MPRNPVAVYAELLRQAQDVMGLDDPMSARSRLYTLLRPHHLERYPELQEVLKRLGIGAGYARNHLLSLGGWPDDVVDFVRRGLPLRVARRLAHVEPTVRKEALKRAEEDRRSLDDATWGQRVERALERLAREADAPDVVPEDGWLPPAVGTDGHPADGAPGPTGDVWRFPTLGARSRADEELHPDLARAILARYTAPGDAIVDLTAGAGTVAQVAAQRGVRSWSSDVHPRASFVHAMDARDVQFTDGLTPGCADLVLLHPPTFAWWEKARPTGSVAGPEGYADLIADLLAGAIQVAAPHALLVLVGRPVRSEGIVRTAIGELQRELEDVGTTLIGYHVGVDARGTEDWHVLVGRRNVEP